MRAWTSPDVPRCSTSAGAGPPCASTTPRPARCVDRPTRTARPGCTSAGSRRTTPPTSATPRPTSPSTCSTGPGATPATRCATSRTSPTSTTRCSSAPPRRRRLGASSPSARSSCSARTWTALRVLPPDEYVGAVESIPLVVELVQQLQERGVVYERRRRPVLLGALPTRASATVSRLDRRRDARGLRRARRRPRPARQEGPARLPAVAGRAARRAAPGTSPLGPRPARLARRVHRDRAAPPRRGASTSRAAAATWSSRTTR